MKTKPFDLEEAKNGAPLVTRDGRKARFIGHVPEVDRQYRVVVHIAGSPAPGFRHEDGKLSIDEVTSHSDLFIQVQTKTVYVNLYPDTEAHYDAYAYESAEAAQCGAVKLTAIAIAVPVEVKQS